MWLDPVLDSVGLQSPRLRLVAGAAIAALAVSLGTVGGLWLVDASADPAVPAALGAAAAAAYGVKAAARSRRPE